MEWIFIYMKCKVELDIISLNLHRKIIHRKSGQLHRYIALYCTQQVVLHFRKRHIPHPGAGFCVKFFTVSVADRGGGGVKGF